MLTWFWKRPNRSTSNYKKIILIAIAIEFKRKDDFA